VRQACRPEDRLARRDPALLVTDEHESPALDDAEPRGVRVPVGHDPGSSAEGKLDDDSSGVGVDDLAFDTLCAGRTLRPAEARTELSDLHAG